MGTSLFGLKPKNTYQGLLKTTDNSAIDATSKFVSDGLGNDSALSLSTSLVGIGTTSPLGLLHLKTTGATTRMVIDGDAGQNRIITYRTSGLQRFGLYVNNTAESGSNVGSDFAIRAYNDAGTLLSTPFFIKRSTQNVGIGTTTPTQNLHISSASNPTVYIERTSADGTSSRVLTNSNFVISPLAELATIGGAQGSNNGFFFGNGFLGVSGYNSVRLFNTGAEAMRVAGGNVGIGTTTTSGAKTTIQGSGSTAATTSLLVQNSGGNESLKVLDNRAISLGGSGKANLQISSAFDGSFNFGTINFANFDGTTYGRMVGINAGNSSFIFGGTSVNSSAKVQFDSTTQGFLPPRMTNTQALAIVTPAEGLVVYNTTISHLCCYQAGAWVKFNHSPM